MRAEGAQAVDGVARVRVAASGVVRGEYYRRIGGSARSGRGFAVGDRLEEPVRDDVVAGIVGVDVVGEEPRQVAALVLEGLVQVDDERSLLARHRLDTGVDGGDPLVAAGIDSGVRR